MTDLHPALSSLYDSLNALFSRMSGSDPQSMRVASIMLTIGEYISGASADDGGDGDTVNTLAGAVSTIDAQSGALGDLLGEIENFLGRL